MKPEEIKNKIKEISMKEGFVDGIYNYCDRWCERCQYTSKCRNFAFGQEGSIDNDINNKEFWDNLSNIFQATFMLVEEGMQEMGIDINELPEITEEDIIANPKEHPLYKLSHEISFEVHDWINKNESLLKSLSKTNMLISEERAIRFIDAIEVIQWYNFFISAKINRALPKYKIEEYDDDFQSDSLGSAKIAIISIKRLIASWSVILEMIPEHEDKILLFLSKLSKLLKQTKKEFPEAMSFKRPGFDD